MPNRYNILFVDQSDSPLDFFNKTNGIENSFTDVQTMNCPLEAIKELKSNPFKYDLVLADINHKNKSDGIEFLEQMREEGIQVNSIIISDNIDKTRAMKAIRLRVHDLFEKPVCPAELKNSIDSIINSCTNKSEKIFISDLSRQNIQILECVLRGCRNKEIAKVTHLNERTVKYHLQQIFKYYECKNRKELILKFKLLQSQGRLS